jgi:Icc-related predicted phosphoesterase
MPVGGPQLSWLEGVLSDAERRGLRVVVAVHHPPYSSGREEGSIPWVAERLVHGVLDHHRVALVVNGHAHAYERLERRDPSGRPITFVVTGGGGATLFHEASSPTAGSKVFVEGVWHYVSLELSDSAVRGRMVPVTIPGRPAPPASARDAFELELQAAGQ